MKPNFKKLAKNYREEYYHAEMKLSGAYQTQLRMMDALEKKEQEIAELKAKYSDLLNSNIALQESIIMKEIKQ